MLGGLQRLAQPGGLCTLCARAYSVVGLDPVTDTLAVPKHITLPSYHRNGIPPPRLATIDIKSKDTIDTMREAGHIAGAVLDMVLDNTQAGVTTDELDKLAHSMIVKRAAYPAPLNYRGFPKSICTSVNNVLCHGIPNTRLLQAGDIVSIDVSVYYKGVFGDCCSTVAVGACDESALQLIQLTKDCTLDSVAQCRPGASFSVIGNTISKHVGASNFSINKEFIGHGIGHYFHGLPEVYHYANEHGPAMKTGMVFTIEPIIMEGGDGMYILNDGWTAVTSDGMRAAQFEHTIVVTDDGYEIISPHR